MTSKERVYDADIFSLEFNWLNYRGYEIDKSLSMEVELGLKGSLVQLAWNVLVYDLGLLYIVVKRLI